MIKVDTGHYYKTKINMSICWVCYIYDIKHTRTHKYAIIIEIVTGKEISLLLVWNFLDYKLLFHLKQLFLLWNFFNTVKFFTTLPIIIIAKADCAFLDKIYFSIKLRNRFLLEPWLNWPKLQRDEYKFHFPVKTAENTSV